jgi:hypothetical protein
MKPSSGLVQKSGMDCAKKKCPLKRGLNNDQPEFRAPYFPQIQVKIAMSLVILAKIVYS